MELRCPHCGKLLAMSLQELASSNGVVVCPQCLGEFKAQHVDLSGIKPSRPRRQAPKPGRASTTQAVVAAVYCHHCGKRLPAAQLNYCPYCGNPLSFDDTSAGNKVAATASPEKKPQRHLDQDGGGETPRTVNTELLNAPLHFRPELHTRDLKEEPASLPVRIVCWLVIVALIALFFFIVYMGNKA